MYQPPLYCFTYGGTLGSTNEYTAQIPPDLLCASNTTTTPADSHTHYEYVTSIARAKPRTTPWPRTVQRVQFTRALRRQPGHASSCRHDYRCLEKGALAGASTRSGSCYRRTLERLVTRGGGGRCWSAPRAASETLGGWHASWPSYVPASVAWRHTSTRGARCK